MDLTNPRDYQMLLQFIQYANAAKRAQQPGPGGWKTQAYDPENPGTSYQFPASAMTRNPGRFVGPEFQNSLRTGTPYYSPAEQKEWVATGVHPNIQLSPDERAGYARERQQQREERYPQYYNAPEPSAPDPRAASDRQAWANDWRSQVNQPGYRASLNPQETEGNKLAESLAAQQRARDYVPPANANYDLAPGSGWDKIPLSSSIPVGDAERGPSWFAPRGPVAVAASDKGEQDWQRNQLFDASKASDYEKGLADYYPGKYQNVTPEIEKRAQETSMDYTPAPGPTPGIPEAQRLGRGVQNYFLPKPGTVSGESLWPGASEPPSSEDALLKILRGLTNYSNPAEMPAGGYGMGDIPYQGRMPPWDVIFGD
jgi:hypothetical protein